MAISSRRVGAMDKIVLGGVEGLDQEHAGIPDWRLVQPQPAVPRRENCNKLATGEYDTYDTGCDIVRK